MSDLISRQDAIGKIREVYEYEFPTASGEFDEFVTMIIPNLLRNLPSAEPERKWIRVTKALPNDMDRLLVTIVRPDGEKRVRSGHYYKGYFMMDNGDTWNETDKEVLAWMPLPEVYRGE